MYAELSEEQVLTDMDVLGNAVRGIGAGGLMCPVHVS